MKEDTPTTVSRVLSDGVLGHHNAAVERHQKWRSVSGVRGHRDLSLISVSLGVYWREEEAKGRISPAAMSTIRRDRIMIVVTSVVSPDA